MKKTIIIAFFAFLVALSAWGQQVVVAVAPFEAKSGNAASDADTLANIFGVELQAKRSVRVVTRGSVAAVMAEHKFQTSDLSSDKKTAELGKAASADWVVRGTVEKLGSMIAVTVSLLDVNTLEVMGGAPMYLGKIEEAAFKMEEFIALVDQRVRGSGANIRPAGSARPQTGGTGIGIDVKTTAGGTLYFKGEEIGTLWDNDEYTIPIDRPGVYEVKFVLHNGQTVTRSVSIASRGTYTVYFPTMPLDIVLKDIQQKMVRVPSGTFSMGSASGESNESPVHKVTLNGFYISKTEVTQDEYEAVMKSNPSGFKGGNLPVEQVTWYDAVNYCNALSRAAGLSPAYTINGSTVTWNKNAGGYRLPTEAEWEYACGGGGEGWCEGNSRGKTHPVGEKAANQYGLHDMLGNVWEWCYDWYDSYSSSSQTNPSGPSSGSLRVNRGGSWYSNAQLLRSAFRGIHSPSFRNDFLGFRLVRSEF